MSGDEVEIFNRVVHVLTHDRPDLQERNRIFSVYKVITGRDWVYDYSHWYVPMIEGRNPRDSRSKGQSESKESIN